MKVICNLHMLNKAQTKDNRNGPLPAVLAADECASAAVETVELFS